MHSGIQHDRAIASILSEVPEIGPHEPMVSFLTGGLTNRNYLVEADGRQFVLRIGGENTSQLGIDRAQEHRCAKAVAAAGVGPEVVAFLPAHNALVTRYVAGRVLQAGSPPDTLQLRRIARAVRAVHECVPPPGLKTFSPFETVRSYFSLAQTEGVVFPGSMAAALTLLDRIEKSLPSITRPRLCHNDLLPSNFIDAGLDLRIIDWEYGGLGDPFFDLGNLAVNHNLTEAQEYKLLRHYAGAVVHEDLHRMRLMRLVSDMREALWGYLQAGISSLAFDYVDYGRTHLERFLRAAKSLEQQGMF